ncbi:hypothetical protein J0S82_019739, partial [Galemys pyrenaicus]
LQSPEGGGQEGFRNPGEEARGGGALEAPAGPGLCPPDGSSLSSLPVLDTQYSAREGVSAEAGESARHHRSDQRHLRWAQHWPQSPGTARSKRQSPPSATSLTLVWLLLRGVESLGPEKDSAKAGKALGNSQSCACSGTSAGPSAQPGREARGRGSLWLCPAGPACRRRDARQLAAARTISAISVWCIIIL